MDLVFDNPNPPTTFDGWGNLECFLGHQYLRLRRFTPTLRANGEREFIKANISELTKRCTKHHSLLKEDLISINFFIFFVLWIARH
jgi:hypothetical protein